MDRNTITGLGLIAVILIGFGYFNQPSDEQKAQIRHERDSIAQVMREDSARQATLVALQKEKAQTQEQEQALAPSEAKDTGLSQDSLNQSTRSRRYGIFADAAEKENEFFTLENENVRVKFSSLGGMVASAELKNYRTFDSLPLIMFQGDSNLFRLQFPTRDNQIVNTNELFFKNEPSRKSNEISLRLYAGAPDKYIEYVYSLAAGEYMLNFKVNLVGMQDIIPANSSYLSADWTQNVTRVEKSLENERNASSVYYKFTDEEVDYLSLTEAEKESLPTRVKWIAFKQQFFTSVIIPDQEFEKPITVETFIDLNSTRNVKYMMANFALPYGHKQKEVYGMRFYFGPNHVQTLKSYDLALEKLVPLGWGIFGWVNRYLVIPTFNFLDGFNLNYGLIIFILAVLIKIVLLPLTYKAYMSQAKMKVLKPEIDEINAKYPGDTMKIQQETMSLYRKGGVNPLGGCLPLILQLPILIAMFNFFPSSIELRQQPFLWAHDLSTYDSIYDFGFNIPFYGDHISLWVILMTISTILYTMMNNQMMAGGNSAMQQQMKWMGYIMPIVFMGVLNSYASGLSYYYFLANVTGFAQQYLFRYFVDDAAIHAKIQENKKKPVKKSSFQARLEEMAKQKKIKK